MISQLFILKFAFKKIFWLPTDKLIKHHTVPCPTKIIYDSVKPEPQTAITPHGARSRSDSMSCFHSIQFKD